jgi:hypothetical protein
MLNELLSVLSETETQQLMEALPKIGLLIAGADGVIDEKEIEWGAKLTYIRAYKAHGKHGAFDEINEYFERIDEQYRSNFENLLKIAPANTTERTDFLSAELSALNGILDKLDPEFASSLYQNFLSFAKHIARADGGILGFASISNEENRLLDLDMIHPR